MTEGSLEMALVARRFYLDQKSKSEIAEEFGLSRFKVARLLDEAVQTGVVTITVAMPSGIDGELGAQLCERFDLRHALVVSGDDPSGQQLGAVAAKFIESTITDGDTLGLPWGATVARVIDSIEALPRIDVVQLVGGVRTAGLDTNGTELVRRLSHRTGGRAFPLMAPFVVDSEETALALKSETGIAHTLDQFPRVTTALVGIGTWEAGESTLAKELGESDRELVVAQGASADICGIILGPDGQPVSSSLSHRTLAITFDQLSSIPTVIAVASGATKVAAISVALHSGLLEVLVTDSATAQQLLS